MGNYTIYNAVATLFGLLGFIFAMVAICTNSWISDGTEYSGLWSVCQERDGSCDNLIIGSNRKYANYEMVRGFGVLAVIMTFLGTIVTALNLVVKKNIGPSVMATLFLMAAFFGLVCVALFTSLSEEAKGYSFGLGWASFPTTLIAGLIMTYIEVAQKD